MKHDQNGGGGRKCRQTYEPPKIVVCTLATNDVITTSVNERDYDIGKADIFDENWGIVK